MYGYMYTFKSVCMYMYPTVPCFDVIIVVGLFQLGCLIQFGTCTFCFVFMYFGKEINSQTVNHYSILPRILGRPRGLLTQIFDSACTLKKSQFALTSFSFLFHASWVDCLSFPLRVVTLLKMTTLGFQSLLRVSSLKGPYVCWSILRWLPFGETSASLV